MSFVANIQAVRPNFDVPTLISRLEGPLNRAMAEIGRRNLETVTMIFFREIAYDVRKEERFLLEVGSGKAREIANKMALVEDEALRFVKDGPHDLLATPFRNELQALINRCDARFDSTKKYVSIGRLLSQFHEKGKHTEPGPISCFQFSIATQLVLPTAVRYRDAFEIFIKERAVTIPERMLQACDGRIGDFDYQNY